MLYRVGVIVALGALLLACEKRSHEAARAAVIDAPEPPATFALLPSARASRTPVAAPPPADADAIQPGEDAELAAAWVQMHRRTLWRIAETLPDRLKHFEDGGCGPVFGATGTLGQHLARERRLARRSSFYFERLECHRRHARSGYRCAATFGKNGSNDDSDFALSVQFRVDDAVNRVDAPAICVLAG